MKRSEIRVTVGGELCEERQAEGDDVNTVSPHIGACTLHVFSLLQYVCAPPKQPPNGNREATVMVSV